MDDADITHVGDSESADGASDVGGEDTDLHDAEGDVTVLDSDDEDVPDADDARDADVDDDVVIDADIDDGGDAEDDSEHADGDVDQDDGDDASCSSSAEVECDGRDDDCDGLIDEFVCDGCETHYFLDGTYLFCSENSLDGREAADFCQDRGYELAIITSAEEDQWCWETASSSVYSDWYIGLSDAARESIYVWPDGSVAWDNGPLMYTNWRDEPLIHHQSEDCVELDGSSEGLWADNDCSETQPYICELL